MVWSFIDDIEALQIGIQSEMEAYREEEIPSLHEECPVQYQEVLGDEGAGLDPVISLRSFQPTFCRTDLSVWLMNRHPFPRRSS